MKSQEILRAFSFPVSAIYFTYSPHKPGEYQIVEQWGDAKQIFPWMSVSKLATARTVLGAVEHEVVGLEEILAEEVRLKDGTSFDFLGRGISLRHLLSHSSGLKFSQAEQASPPQERRIYSNLGYELAAALIEKRSGVAFSGWLKAMLWEPLGIEPELRNSPAYGIWSNIFELARFAVEFGQGSLISPVFQEAIFTPIFPHLDGVLPGYGMQKPNPWGLGPEIRQNKAPHWTSVDCPEKVAGHFGQSGSFLWVDRHRCRGAVFLGAENFGAEHKELWPHLNRLWGA